MRAERRGSVRSAIFARSSAKTRPFAMAAIKSTPMRANRGALLFRSYLDWILFRTLTGSSYYSFSFFFTVLFKIKYMYGDSRFLKNGGLEGCISWAKRLVHQKNRRALRARGVRGYFIWAEAEEGVRKVGDI